jgi:hypothetical protein
MNVSMITDSNPDAMQDAAGMKSADEQPAGFSHLVGSMLKGGCPLKGPDSTPDPSEDVETLIEGFGDDDGELNAPLADLFWKAVEQDSSTLSAQDASMDQGDGHSLALSEGYLDVKAGPPDPGLATLAGVNTRTEEQSEDARKAGQFSIHGLKAGGGGNEAQPDPDADVSAFMEGAEPENPNAGLKHDSLNEPEALQARIAEEPSMKALKKAESSAQWSGDKDASSAAKEDAPLKLRIGENSFLVTRTGERRLEVILQPEGMGKLELEINLDNDLINAHINASVPEGKEIIERNLSNIMNLLAREGLSVGSFSVALKRERGTLNQHISEGDGDHEAKENKVDSVVMTGNSVSIFV